MHAHKVLFIIFAFLFASSTFIDGFDASDFDLKVERYEEARLKIMAPVASTRVIDSQKDGFPEIIEYYDKDNNFLKTEYDLNQNGIIESMDRQDRESFTVYLRDNNEDGLFEEKTGRDFNPNLNFSVVIFRDEDSDGFYEASGFAASGFDLKVESYEEAKSKISAPITSTEVTYGKRDGLSETIKFYDKDKSLLKTERDANQNGIVEYIERQNGKFFTRLYDNDEDGFFEYKTSTIYLRSPNVFGKITFKDRDSDGFYELDYNEAPDKFAHRKAPQRPQER